MNDSLLNLLRDLGLANLAPLERHEETLRVAPVGAAFASQGPLSPGAVFARTILDDSANWLSKHGGSDAMIAQATERPGVFLLDVTGFTVRGLDELVWSDEGVLLVDASRAPCSLLLERADARIALTLERARVTSMLLPVGEPQRLPEPASPPVFDLPPLRSLLGDLEIDSWIASRYEAAASHPVGVIERAASLGSLLRHAAPRDATGSKHVDEGPLERADRLALPARRVLDWAASLDATQRDELTRAGCERAQALAESLASLTLHIAESPKDAVRGALRWLRDRDDLESVAALLGSGTEQRVVLSDALETLDEEAILDASAWREVAPLDDVQLRAGLCDDPSLWWGTWVR